MAAENFKVKKGLEVGTGITANSDGVNVTGIVTATQFKGDGSGLTGVVGSGSGVVVKDEGSAVGTAGTINFVGSGVAAVISEGTATVTINAGGLDNVVEDTTPQLGGNLDLNSKFITGTGNIDITGSLDVSGISTFAGITTVTGETLFTKQLNVTGVSTFGNNINASGTSRFEIASMENGVLDGEISHNGDATTKIKFPSNNNISLDTDGTTRLNINNSGANITGVITATGANITGIATFTGGVAKLLFNGNQKLTTTINGIEVPDLNVTGVGTVGRLDTNGVTLGTNNNTFAAKFVDDAVANFGTDNDLKISHDDTHARITNTKGNIVVSGIISATSDVKVGSAITMDPTSGIITATAFHGDGSNLTGISGGGSVTSDAQLNTLAGTNAGDGFSGTSANENTLIGYDAGTDINSGDNNTVVGAYAGKDINTGGSNTFLGRRAGHQVTSGSESVAIGSYSLAEVLTTSSNTAVGNMSLRNCTGEKNSCSGNSSGYNITSGSDNTCLGFAAGSTSDYSNSTSLTTGSNNILIGKFSAPSANNVSNEITLGNSSITKLRVPGIGVTFKDNGGTPTQGHVLTVDANGEASFAAASGGGGSGVTVQDEGSALSTSGTTLNFVGSGVVASGTGATKTITIAGGVTFPGGTANTVAGTNAGDAIVSGASHNTLFGHNAGQDINTGDYNTFVGSRSGYNASTGLHNTGVGYNVMGNHGGWGGAALGRDAGNGMGGSNYSVAIGMGAYSNITANGDNNIVIGYQANVSSSSASNEITFGNDDITKLRVPGIGLSFTSAGAVISGLVTATTFSGSGASLTTLNASELDSGTIPNGRFPATLPAASGANLTSLTAGNISGTLASGQIADEAITFAKMQHVGTGVLIGRNDGGTGDMETLSAAEVRTLLNVADGATAGITTAPSNIVATWNVVNNGASSYRFTGPGQNPTADNPDIYLVRGNTYRFALSASGHPFQIRVSNGGSAYNSGVTNNGAQTGNVEFYVQNDAPASLVYQCTSHGGMVGNIYITGHQLTNGANNRVLTATSAYGMTGESGLTFDGNILEVNHSGGGNGVAINGISGEDVAVIRQRGDNHHAIILRGTSNADGSTITGTNIMEFREYGHYIFKTGAGTMAERIRITNSEMKFTANQTFNADDTYSIGANASKAARMYSHMFVYREGTGGSVASGGQTAEVIKFDNSGITMLHDSVTLSTAATFSAMTGNRAAALLRMRNNTGPVIESELGGVVTPSDYRIKENIVGITSAISTVKKLNPIEFTWKKSWNPDDDGKTEQGFLAHEVSQAIVNDKHMVHGEKDAVNSDGSIKNQGMDYGKLTPVLTAAVKELIAEVETLKAEVAALKSS